MNYYEHHLGDYLRDTAHLSMLEDGAYRRLLDAYYIREAPLPLVLREVYRLVRASSKQDREAVETVLREFFTETPEGWTHNRCDREISRFQDKQRKARASAEARWSHRQPQSEGNANASANAMRTHSEGNAPRARPQTPDTRHQTPEPTPSLRSVETRGIEEALSGGSTVVGANKAEKPAAVAAPAQPAARGSRIPADWQLPKAWGDWALAEYAQWTPAKVRLEAEKFRDHWAAKTGREATKADWQATWRNWCRSDIAHRDDPRPGAASRPGRMTDDELRAANAAANAEAARLLFGDQPRDAQEAIRA